MILGQAAAWGATGQLVLTVVDKDTGKPIACRLHLMSAKGQPRRVEKVPFWADHAALPGTLKLNLPLGNYTFLLERGLEYLDQNGTFTLNVFADDAKQIELRRFADLASEGWYSGDLDIRRPAGEIELLMLADDLHLGEVVTWGSEKAMPKEKAKAKTKSAARGEPRPSEKTKADGKGKSGNTEENVVSFDGNRCYRLLAGIESRPDGEIIYHRLTSPLKLGPPDAPFPSLIQDAVEAKKQKEAWIEIANAASWDMPTLVALKLADSIQIAGGRLCREKVVADDGGGKPRDKKRFPDPDGSVRWSQELYFRLLECGVRIPPSAGSGSGVAPNPVGYNRVYVHLDGDFGYDAWWEGLRAGRAFVTNGPLVRVSVEGQPPGYVFTAEKGQNRELEIAMTLSTREEIHYLEIIKNGLVEKSIRMDEYVEAVKSNQLPKIEFTESGWFLVRAVCQSPKTYRFALTAPYFVTIGDRPRVSKKAAQFFLDWVYERAKQIKLDNADEQKKALSYQRQARDYWKNLVKTATAE